MRTVIGVIFLGVVLCLGVIACGADDATTISADTTMDTTHMAPEEGDGSESQDTATAADTLHETVPPPDTGVDAEEVQEPDSGPTLPSGVFALNTLDPEASTDDLAPLSELMGSTLVVGLGESAHTTGGFIQAKHRLIRFLVAEHGFRVVAFETEWGRADIVTQYLQTCSSKPSTVVLAGMRGAWQDQTVADLLEWLCEFNQQHPEDPVGFFGFNNFQPWDDAPVLVDFFQEFMPASTEQLNLDIAQCEGVTSSNEKEYRTAHPPAMPVLKANYESCSNALTEIETYIQANTDLLLETLTQEELQWLNLHLISLRGWEDYVYGRNPEGGQWELKVMGLNSRDNAMATIFTTIHTLRYPGKRVVLSSHNLHINTASDSINAVFPPMAAQFDYMEGVKRMGSHLEEVFGDEYVTLAFLSYHHNIAGEWIDVFPDQLSGVSDGAPILENLLHELEQEILFVDLSVAESGEPPFINAQQAYGMTFPDWDPQQQAMALVVIEGIPLQLHDGILFLAATAPWQPL